MKIIVKWMLMLLSVMIIIAGGTAIYLSTQKDKIQSFIIDELNNNINAIVNAGDLDIKLFHNLPYLSATFSDVEVIPYHEKGEKGRDTVLLANKVFIDIDIWRALVKKKVLIRSLEISDGMLYLIKSGKGSVNWNIWQKEHDPKKKESAFTIRSFRANNLRIVYSDMKSGLNGEIFFHQLRINEFPWQENFYRFRLAGTVDRLAKQKKTWIGSQKLFEMNGYLKKGDDRIEINKSHLKLANNFLDVRGYLLGEEGKYHLEGTAVDVKPLKTALTWGMIPDSLYKDIHEKEGWDCSFYIDGNTTSTSGIKGEVSFETKGYKILWPGMDWPVVIIKNCSGKYLLDVNGTNHVTSLVFNNLSVVTGKSALTGDITWQNPGEKGQISANLNAELNAGDLNALLKTEKILLQTGTLTGKVSIRVPVETVHGGIGFIKDQGEIKGEVTVKNFSGGMTESLIYADGISGNFSMNKQIVFRGVKMNWLGFPVVVDGKIPALGTLLFSKDPRNLDIKVRAGTFILDTLMSRLGKFPGEEQKKGKETISNWNLKCDFDIQKFRYRKLAGEKVQGSLIYDARDLKIDPLQYLALDGKGSGFFEWEKNGGGRSVIRAYTDLGHVNISRLFQAFDNFGQTFVTTENIEGFLTGNIAFQTNLDAQGNVDLSSVLSNAVVEVKNGRLKNVKALYSLSKFIKLSELENISFSNLQNEVFVQNQTVIIPSMHIGSSALDLDLYGTHTFENRFSYHIRLLLSDILFHKAGKARQENNEYGIIEKGDNGKTSLYLIYEGDSLNSRVLYDKSRARQARKEEIIKEGKQLKAILHEEMGLFKKDTSLVSTEKKDGKKFRIIFPENDTTRKDSARNKKSNLLNVVWEDEPPDTLKKK
ncbi:MAG: AsmA-like C-terminal region-containing protein [Chlorobi bacterium]|nr:AsmA-like C-terminal region-containing protein [Chlorobiota bacterium]